MRACCQLVVLLAAMIATDARAQIWIPPPLPASDFVWSWGSARRGDDLERPEFEIIGHQEKFRCTLTGSFRVNSRMSDFYNLRNFEQELITSSFFIEAVDYKMYELFNIDRQIQWANLNCIVPEAEPTEEATEERVDRALERAREAQERRRAREDDD